MSQRKPNPTEETVESTELTNNELVHEFDIEFADSITDKIKASDREKGEASVVTKEGSYILPEDVPQEEARDYAVKLANTLLAETRPSEYPPRSPAVWAFACWPEETQMTRRGAITLNTEALLADYSMYAIDFSVAGRLYMRLLQDMPFVGEIDESYVDEKCEAYWESASEVTSIADLPETLSEVYIPTESISSDYFVEVLTSDDGQDYSVYSG